MSKILPGHQTVTQTQTIPDKEKQSDTNVSAMFCRKHKLYQEDDVASVGTHNV